MDFGQIFENALRSVLWFVARFSLMVIDFAYDTLLEIYRIDLTDFPFIWDWFRGNIDSAVYLHSDPSCIYVFQDIL